MSLYHKWDVKNGFACVLQFFSLISDSLGGVPKGFVKTKGCTKFFSLTYHWSLVLCAIVCGHPFDRKLWHSEICAQVHWTFFIPFQNKLPCGFWNCNKYKKKNDIRVLHYKLDKSTLIGRFLSELKTTALWPDFRNIFQVSTLIKVYHEAWK